MHNFQLGLGSRFWKPILLVVLIIMSLANLATANETKPKTPSVPVKVIEVKPGNWPYQQSYPVRLQAFKQVEVHARVSAHIEQQFYKEGQKVEKGQTLYQLDDRRAKADYAIAKANLENAKIRVDLAKRTYERTRGLGQSISVQEIEDSLAEWRSAQAALSAAQAEYDRSQVDLDDTVIEAEITGIIGRKQEDVGDLVGPESGRTLLNTIRQIDPIYGLFSIADADRQRLIQLHQQGLLKLNQPMRVFLKTADGEAPLTGEVDFSDSQIDPKTGSQLIRAHFANSKQQLLPGQLMTLQVQHGEWQNVMAIPQSAVIQNGQQALVYVVKGQQAQMRPVTLAGRYQQQWLISNGLQPGDQVITNNLIKLRPNTPVTVMPAENADQRAPSSNPVQ